MTTKPHHMAGAQQRAAEARKRQAFASACRSARKAAGYSGTDLGALLGVSKGLISHYETGVSVPADLRRVLDIVEATETPALPMVAAWLASVFGADHSFTECADARARMTIAAQVLLTEWENNL